ncbi:MAG: hypothetical protein ABFS03_10590 [Chloroflexota bacterium]
MEVDLVFLEFYESLGGADVLGIAITPKFTQDSVVYQYTTASLMTYDARFPLSQQYALAPIGIKLNISEAPTNIDLPGGHAVHPEFQSIYNQMGKIYFTGLPLTAGRYNPEFGRIEQYFENVGFYHMDTDAPGTVRLLEYGAWYCKPSCDYRSPHNALPVLNSSAANSTPNKAENNQITVPDLGNNGSSTQEIPSLRNTDINLTTWNDQAFITSEDQQVVFVTVQNEKQQPIKDLQPIMILTVPTEDGGTQLFVYTFPPTDAKDGTTSLILDPINAPDGTQVNYQICPWNGAQENLCVLDKFLIWGGQ